MGRASAVASACELWPGCGAPAGSPCTPSMGTEAGAESAAEELLRSPRDGPCSVGPSLPLNPEGYPTVVETPPISMSSMLPGWEVGW